jgi:two-component system NtrC family sensor kinase
MILVNMGITILGMIIAFMISLRIGNTIIKRIRILKKGTEAIASGNLDYRLPPDKISGFDMLDEAFNDMTKSLKDRDERLQKAHKQLVRSERLTALGGMAAGVAHEINNPLGGILLYGNLVLEDIPEDSSARENMQKIIHQTNRCKSIVQGLLNFARMPTGETLPLQINAIIRTALNLVKDQSMFHGIEIETCFAQKLDEVIGDASRLEEVFLNLFINAADAMSEKGGKLKITTSAANNWVRVIITDTGKGIEREHLPHIFEPFYTTKSPGQGTGLGLSIAYGVIKRHNGFINVESTPGQGATFIISLPSSTAKDNGNGTKIDFSTA